MAKGAGTAQVLEQACASFRVDKVACRFQEAMKLINPRGRIVDVSDREVKGLLRRGFLLAPKQSHEYNPIFDKGAFRMDAPEELRDVKRIESDILTVARV